MNADRRHIVTISERFFRGAFIVANTFGERYTVWLV
jgi:hypothetical protein